MKIISLRFIAVIKHARPTVVKNIRQYMTFDIKWAVTYLHAHHAVYVGLTQRAYNHRQCSLLLF
jgi:hypothetical protein